MNPHSTLLIRADAGGHHGIGHVMRMIALSHAWQDRGGKVLLASCECPDAIADRLTQEKIAFVSINAMPGSREDAIATIELAKNHSALCVVLDGYHFSIEFQTILRAEYLSIMCVDDYGHCDSWQAKWVLNPNLHATNSANCDSEPTLLTGPRYALLRREFLNHVSHRVQNKDPDQRLLLVTFGGVDPPGATLQVINALKIIHLKGWRVRILIGAANPRREEIQELANTLTIPAECVLDSKDMPSEYLSADALISSGGGSCLEWLFFQIPAWVISIAENQTKVIEALRDQKLATVGGDFSDFTQICKISESIASWIQAPRPPVACPVDGWGATRIACVLSGSPCWIRPVNPNHEAEVRFLHALSNEASIRSAGYHTSKIKWDEHVAWLHQKCNQAESRLWLILTTDDESAGLVRLHQKDTKTWEVGISLKPQQRGKGIAMEALRLAFFQLHKEHPKAIILATIKPKNMASIRLFTSLGFTLIRQEEDRTEWLLNSLTL